jgi:sec-independent protein translocase protein TatA
MLVVLLVVLLLFGAKRLPELARGMGRAVQEFSSARDKVETKLSGCNPGEQAHPQLNHSESQDRRS